MYHNCCYPKCKVLFFLSVASVYHHKNSYWHPFFWFWVCMSSGRDLLLNFLRSDFPFFWYTDCNHSAILSGGTFMEHSSFLITLVGVTEGNRLTPLITSRPQYNRYVSNMMQQSSNRTCKQPLLCKRNNNNNNKNCQCTYRIDQLLGSFLVWLAKRSIRFAFEVECITRKIRACVHTDVK